jgi:hypothetical protein
MFKVLNKRERVVLYLTLAVVAISIFFNFLIEPTMKRNFLLNQEIRLNTIKLGKYLKVIHQKKELKPESNQPTSYPVNEDFKKDSLIAALAELENIAKSCGVRILDIRPQSDKESGAYRQNIIEFRTEAQMQDYLKFIYDIESSLFLFRIKRMQINSRPNSPILEGSFSISQILP